MAGTAVVERVVALVVTPNFDPPPRISPGALVVAAVVAVVPEKCENMQF